MGYLDFLDVQFVRIHHSALDEEQRSYFPWILWHNCKLFFIKAGDENPSCSTSEQGWHS